MCTVELMTQPTEKRKRTDSESLWSGYKLWNANDLQKALKLFLQQTQIAKVIYYSSIKCCDI